MLARAVVLEFGGADETPFEGLFSLVDDLPAAGQQIFLSVAEICYLLFQRWWRNNNLL